jgi:uncharacterized protein (UPF0248 family)
VAPNQHHIVIETENYNIKRVFTSTGEKYDVGGCFIDARHIDGHTFFSVTFKSDVCEVRINNAGNKAHLKFIPETKIMNLHHIKMIYEKETGRVLWQKYAVSAAHIIIGFTGITLQEGDLPIGRGVFVDINIAISTSWIDSWCNNGDDAFLKLKSSCSVVVTANNEARIDLGNEHVRIPLRNVLEIYEKETGKRIWQRPLLSSVGNKPTP